MEFRGYLIDIPDVPPWTIPNSVDLDVKSQIFVSIASYRDRLLPFTIEAALSAAAHPERLNFGICWLSDEDENLDQWLGDPRFRIRRYPYNASLGYGWARAEAQKLYGGEKYNLLIDSRTWFANHWDSNLIEQLEGKPGKQPLLTTSSPPFCIDKEGQVTIPWAGTDLDGVPLMECKLVAPCGLVDIQMSNDRKTTKHQKSALLSCNFVFTHGSWISAVPADPAMFYADHDPSVSLRTFTHGYDIYLPDELQIWRFEERHNSGVNRHEFWETKSAQWQTQQIKNMVQRLHTLFSGNGDSKSPTAMPQARHGP